uniref:Uncharacterized protein n=1 Tax=Arundo donax TaxID=35708 RepID=A0A0A9AWJ1_ARUDO
MSYVILIAFFLSCLPK